MLSAEFGDPCAQVPVMVEGSILRNLLLGSDSRRRVPTEEEAWKFAKLCGLPAEFLHVRSTCQMIYSPLLATRVYSPKRINLNL